MSYHININDKCAHFTIGFHLILFMITEGILFTLTDSCIVSICVNVEFESVEITIKDLKKKNGALHHGPQVKCRKGHLTMTIMW